MRKLHEKRQKAENGNNSQRITRISHVVCTSSKRVSACVLASCVSRALEIEDLGRAQKVSRRATGDGSLNADKAGTSKNMIITPSSITTKERNYTNC